MIELFTNNASTTLGVALPATGLGSTSITLSSGTGDLFPQPGAATFPTGATTFFRLSLTDATQSVREIVYVTARVGDVCTVTRGKDGTTPRAWNAGDIAAQLVTGGTATDLVQDQELQSGYLNYVVAGGTPTALTGSFTPAVIQSLSPGVVVYLKVAATNTGPVTFNLNNFGASPVVNQNGLPLNANALLAGVIYRMVWDGTRWVSETRSPPELYLLDSGSANAIIVTTGFSLTGLSVGQAFTVKVATTNTAAATIKVDSLSTVPLRSRQGVALNPGVLQGGSSYRVVYDGAVFLADVTNAPAFILGEIKMWKGSPASIASTWGSGWQLADGTSGTADLRDRFIIGCSPTLPTGSLGGSAFTTLSVAQLPSHTHTVTDPSHTHAHTDPGHNHSHTDLGHVHGVNNPAHTHGLVDPGHTHQLTLGGGNGGFNSNFADAANTDGGFATATTFGAATGISLLSATTAVSVNGATTGVTNVAATTGVTNVAATTGISVGSTGSGTQVDNRPPFYALCFIEFVGP